MDPVRFDTKIAILLRDDLAAWQELNVTAFLASGVAAESGMTGEPYRDADGTAYLPMLRQPVLVFAADAATLAAARAKAVVRGLRVAVYIEEIFATGHDEANRAEVARFGGDDLNLVGLALHGPKNVVDRITKAATLHS
ncbi:DUF2000 family protein [Pseudolysinimonas sp.]|uniref:DUF2000 family protein n=1 Tax=Pseudolysinimonas sp. TaxID=2680009 RepID=UPI003F80B9A2